MQRNITSFAYPFDCRAEYSLKIVSLVRVAGFDCAFGTVADVVRGGTDRFQLPRDAIGDWDKEEFTRMLRGWGNIVPDTIPTMSDGALALLSNLW